LLMPAAAAEKWISWLQTATMDINLNIIENKAGVDDLLFELNLAEPNNYKLEYFLNDGEKRTLEIRNNPNDLQVAFMIENGTQAVHSNEIRPRAGRRPRGRRGRPAGGG